MLHTMALHNVSTTLRKVMRGTAIQTDRAQTCSHLSLLMCFRYLHACIPLLSDRRFEMHVRKEEQMSHPG